MNFTATEKLIATTNKYISSDKYSIQTEGHKNYIGMEYTADYVEILQNPDYFISFEVTKEEIIIFFFSNHIHFNDYGIEDDNSNYIDSAVEFLDDLFSYPIETHYITKGDRIIRIESFFVKSPTEKESCAGVSIYPTRIKNVFKRKIKHVETKRFDRETGGFITVSDI